MGMKEEIFSIATALGYDGPTPTSKTKAVHAVAEAVEGGGGGGGDVGYDVTKVWAVPEQTVTSREFVVGEGTEDEEKFWCADVTVGNLAQMYADGQTTLALVVDGAEYAATLIQQADPSGSLYTISGAEGADAAYSILPSAPSDEPTYIIMKFSDTEPTSHTVSCCYVSAATTKEFDVAVSTAAKKDVALFVTFSGFNTGTITADKTPREIYDAYINKAIPVIGRSRNAGYASASESIGAMFPITAAKDEDGGTEFISYRAAVISVDVRDTVQRMNVYKLAYDGRTDEITLTTLGHTSLTSQS